MIPTYYELLGLPENVSTTVIKDVYRKLAFICFPDRLLHWADPLDIPFLQDMYNRLKIAHEVLIDTEARRHYDNALQKFRTSFPISAIAQREAAAYLNRWQDLQHEYKQYEKKCPNTNTQLQHARMLLGEWQKLAHQQTTVVSELTARENLLRNELQQQQVSLHDLLKNNQELEAQLVQQQAEYEHLYAFWIASITDFAPPAAAAPNHIKVSTTVKEEKESDKKPIKDCFFITTFNKRHRTKDSKPNVIKGLENITKIFQKKSDSHVPICIALSLQYSSDRAAVNFINFFNKTFNSSDFTVNKSDRPDTVLVTFKEDSVFGQTCVHNSTQPDSLFHNFEEIFDLNGIPVTEKFAEQPQTPFVV